MNSEHVAFAWIFTILNSVEVCASAVEPLRTSLVKETYKLVSKNFSPKRSTLIPLKTKTFIIITSKNSVVTK